MKAKVTCVTGHYQTPSMEERQNRLGELVGQLIKEGWTQTALATAIGVDISTVYRWVKGKTIPESDSKNFRKLAQLTGGDSELLELYLNGEISLSDYRYGLASGSLKQLNNAKTCSAEEIKKEVLAKIYLLDPADILDIISTSAAFLSKRA